MKDLKIEEVLKNLSAERKDIYSKLNERSWFKNSNPQIQKDIFLLPADFDAFLADLSSRPDTIGNLDVLEMTKIHAGNYHVICVFKTKSLINNQVIDYEYVATKHGKNPGFKGLLFIEVDGNIKYFLLKRTVRFPLGYETYDSVGGFIKFQNGQLLNLPKKVEEEIKRQLNTDTLNIKRFIDLGQMYTDTSMTNNHISLFAGIINGDNIKNLNNIKGKVFKTKGIAFETQLIPIEQLQEYIYKIDDSYFHTCLSRLYSMGIIKL